MAEPASLFVGTNARSVPEVMASQQVQHLAAISRLLNVVASGKINNVCIVGLATGATETDVPFALATTSSGVFLFPRNAAAAAAMATGSVFALCQKNGTVTIAHNSDDSERLFSLAVLG